MRGVPAPPRAGDSSPLQARAGGGEALMARRSLIAVRARELQNHRGVAVIFPIQSKVGYNQCAEWSGQSDSQSGPACRESRSWLIEPNVPRGKIDG